MVHRKPYCCTYWNNTIHCGTVQIIVFLTEKTIFGVYSETVLLCLWCKAPPRKTKETPSPWDMWLSFWCKSTLRTGFICTLSDARATYIKSPRVAYLSFSQRLDVYYNSSYKWCASLLQMLQVISQLNYFHKYVVELPIPEPTANVADCLTRVLY